MPMQLEDLDARTRREYERQLREAVADRDDGWLADQLRRPGLLETHERRRTASGVTMARVPTNAGETLAEGEFNRFYARGLCARAVEDAVAEVEVYRAKPVARPGAQSEAMLGSRIPAAALLEDLRTAQGVEPALGLPRGPNSGLSVRLPR